MPKFRIRLKIQAFELEVDGEREDIPAITSAVQQQFTALIQPAELMAEDPRQLSDNHRTIDAETSKPAGKTTRRRTTAKATVDAPNQAIEFRHDPGKYGNPLQAWSITEKLIWLLAVIKGITSTSEVSGPQLAATFNQYFKQSGRVHPPNATRELRSAKAQNPALVGEDKGNFFLTEQGERQAQQLIQNVLNPPAA
jgi:hypothetical protein